ncbi:MAG: hypothetical protein ABI615_04845 [Chthoniobacterales bacterium]
MKKIHSLIALAALMMMAGCTTGANKQSAQAGAVRSFARNVKQVQVTLYSLNPNGPSGSGDFHGFGIVGQAPITKAGDKRILLDTLAIGIDNGRGAGHVCFKPRHGLRVTFNGQTTDYVICLQCERMKVYTNGKVQSVRIANTPAPIYYGMLPKYNIPAPPK